MAVNSNYRSNNNNDEVYFEIVSYIGVLAEYQTGWKKEINIVSWNGANPKFDIRDWSPEHDRMSRGITLHEEEARRLAAYLAQRFVKSDNANTQRNNTVSGNEKNGQQNDQIKGDDQNQVQSQTHADTTEGSEISVPASGGVQLDETAAENENEQETELASA